LALDAQGFAFAAQGLALDAQGFAFAAQGLALDAQGFAFAAQGLVATSALGLAGASDVLEPEQPAIAPKLNSDMTASIAK
jgi:hypothetical protein